MFKRTEPNQVQVYILWNIESSSVFSLTVCHPPIPVFSSTGGGGVGGRFNVTFDAANSFISCSLASFSSMISLNLKERVKAKSGTWTTKSMYQQWYVWLWLC